MKIPYNPVVSRHTSTIYEDLTALDLFAGAGGTGLGFSKAGFRIVAAVELDAYAAETYSRNLGSRVATTDIRSVCPKSFREDLKMLPGELSVLIGCPPCQGFSRMRNGAGADDDRNRLVMQYLAFVDEFRPALAFFENVPGLIKSLHGRAFHTILRAGLQKLGYALTERCINSADYGVPQQRERVILLGGHGGKVPPFPRATHADPISQVAQHGFRVPWITVRDAIGKYPQKPDQVYQGTDSYPSNHVASVIGESVLSFIRRVPKDGGSRADVPEEEWLRCHLDHTGHRDVYGRSSWDRPSNTLTAGCTNPSKGRFVHPEEDRAFTLREAAALQGFPDSFVFYGKKIAAQIGNAVPPPVAYAVAQTLREHLRCSRNGGLRSSRA